MKDRIKIGDSVKYTNINGETEVCLAIDIDNGTLILQRPNGEEIATGNW